LREKTDSIEKTRILIVDEEPITLQFFDVMLSRFGFDVITAEDGEIALEKIREYKPDIILLDNIIPKLSGWEVTKIVKHSEEYKNFSDIPIIMFSALDDVEDKVEGFALGVEDYITKPFNFSEVLARIRAVLRNRKLSKQVLKKERRITLIQSLNDSLIYFTEHLKQPVYDLLNSASNIDCSNKKEVDEFIEMVKNECEGVLAALSGLEDEIKELKEAGERERIEEPLLKDLEEKFQKHFIFWKENSEKLNGALR